MIFSRITYWMKGYDTEQQKQSCQNQEEEVQYGQGQQE